MKKFSTIILFLFLERRDYIKLKKIQEWLPYDNITYDGIIISKNKFIKILKITPINYELKSELEKKAILESYKLFLRTCNFDIQILIQSRKENILNTIKNIIFDNKEKINLIKNEYIFFIENLNLNSEMSSKNFYILLSIPKENSQKINIENIRKIFIEKILKIIDTLSKCGNTVLNISERKEVIKILDLFLNPYKD